MFIKFVMKKNIKVGLFLSCSLTLNALTPSYISVFGGIGTHREINEIFEASYDLNASMLGISAQHDLKTFNRNVSLFVEYQLIQHIGIQHSEEVTLQPILKFSNIFNSSKIPLNFTIGDGPSFLLGGAPKLEEKRGKTQRGLNVLSLELSVPINESKDEVFLRIHHRCTLFGKIAPSGGSNFWIIGYRFMF